ncbi:hypothetical protein D3C84_1043110 [compost metagenome]
MVELPDHLGMVANLNHLKVFGKTWQVEAMEFVRGLQGNHGAYPRAVRIDQSQGARFSGRDGQRDDLQVRPVGIVWDNFAVQQNVIGRMLNLYRH